MCKYVNVFLYRHCYIKIKMKNIIILLTTLLTICSTTFCSFRKNINEGNKLFYKQKYEQAQEKYNSAEIEKPNSAILYYNRGNNYYKQQIFDEAIKEYQKSLGLTKDKNLKSKILFNMGNAYLKLGDTQRAKESYLNALKLNPKDEDIKYNLQYALLNITQKQPFSDKQQQQKEQQSKDKQQQKQQQQKRYMSEQDVQRLIESVTQQQKDKLKETLKPQKPQLPPVDKDW